MVVIIFGTLVLHYRCGVGLNSRARWRACVSGRRRSGGRAWHCWRRAGALHACTHADKHVSGSIKRSLCTDTLAPSLPPQSLRWSIRLFTVSHSSRPGYVCVTALSQRNGVRHLHCQCFSVKWVEIGVGECVLPESAINDS